MNWFHRNSGVPHTVAPGTSHPARFPSARGPALVLLLAGFALAYPCYAQQPAPLPEAPSSITPESGTISGVVVDLNQGIVPEAHVVLTGQEGDEERTVTAGDDGAFTFADVAPGTYRIKISAPGLESFISDPIVMRPEEHFHLRGIGLPIASTSSSITVAATADQIATEQIHAQIQQRALGVFPNFYTSYIWNPAPLKAKHKFYLAFRSTTDPVNFLSTAGVAGIEQLRHTHPGYGDGIEGYGKRYGADFGNLVIGRFIGGAILPSLFHQDPRYFYQGSGSVASRSFHAISSTFVTRGDNGHSQPNFSYLIGVFAAAGITNLYYPDNDRTAQTVVDNVLIRIGTHGIGNLVREFISRKITTKIPDYASGKPASANAKSQPVTTAPQPEPTTQP